MKEPKLSIFLNGFVFRSKNKRIEVTENEHGEFDLTLNNYVGKDGFTSHCVNIKGVAITNLLFSSETLEAILQGFIQYKIHKMKSDDNFVFPDDLDTLAELREAKETLINDSQ